MRIVIDMQGAQTESRFRGIGRYTMSFAKGVVRNRGEHEVILALSGLFPETIEPIRAEFQDLLPQKNIRVWYAPGPVAEEHPGNDARRQIAELIREAFLASLQPDVIHISSLFESSFSSSIVSIGCLDKHSPVSISVDANTVIDKSVNILRQACCLFAFTKEMHEKLVKINSLEEATVSDFSNYLYSIVPAEKETELTKWDQMAKAAIAEWEAIVACKFHSSTNDNLHKKPKLAFVSPLPPERTGIADYSAELLPALSEFYDIDVVVEQTSVSNGWIENHCQIRDAQWLRQHAKNYDRVVYQVGNSPFHAYMLSLIKEVPGTLVLHDFYISGLKAWIETVKGVPNYWFDALYSAYGYKAVQLRYQDPAVAQINYPANWALIKHANGVVVHSRYAKRLAQHWYGDQLSRDWEIVPHLRTPSKLNQTQSEVRKLLGFSSKDFLICSFGFLGEAKLNHRLLQCWQASELSKDKTCHLVFVGENPSNAYGEMLVNKIKSSKAKKRIHITGFASPEVFQQYLSAANCAVQLRTLSRGETSGTVLDCMNYGLPLIVNANGSMAELDAEAVCVLPDEFDDSQLISALERLWSDEVLRREMGEVSQKIIKDKHSPEHCARLYSEAIEKFYEQDIKSLEILLKSVASIDTEFTEKDLFEVSTAIAKSLPSKSPTKTLFLDITATCSHDLKTGIERVARALTIALIQESPQGYRIEPVYLEKQEEEWVYRHARKYTLGLLECPSDGFLDEIAEPQCGDIFLGLDISGDRLVHANQAGLINSYRDKGVLFYFMIFDLLPLEIPEVFPPDAGQGFKQWLESASSFDGVVTISQSVADTFKKWLDEEQLSFENKKTLNIDWLHLGADIQTSKPSLGLPVDSVSVLEQIKKRPSFLLVGTIEPRKGYLQVINSFEQLWGKGVGINLVIVGREGWLGLDDSLRRDIPETIQKLRNHSELNKKLFWLEGISDEYLEKVYAASSCLIAASYGEGFGLPLIEAAQHKLPILARDIPVFREVAGEHASYFAAEQPEQLAEAVRQWLELYKQDKHPKSDQMPWLTWKQSAQNLLDIIVH